MYNGVVVINYRKILQYIIPLSMMLVLTGGCAYFNSFYLAQKNFNDAELAYRRNDERVTSAAMNQYQEAIKWSSEVYHLYPDSRYVDDSLFIYGMASYRTRDYTMARDVFDQLISRYPDSKLVLKAKYYKAMSLIAIDRQDDATAIFRELVLESDSEIRGMAGLGLAEIASMDEDWESLLINSQDVLDANPNDDVQTEALIYKAEALSQLERYEEAIETLRPIENRKITPEERFHANTIVAESLARIGQHEEALRFLNAMENRGEFVPFEPRIRLEVGQIQELSGQELVAEDTYRKLAGDFPDSLAAKEAWYRVGAILIKDLSNADEAKTAFDEVAKSNVITEATWSVDARLKSALIDTMKARIERIEGLREEPDKLAAARYSLAELYQYSFERPDSALTQYRMILDESPDSEFAAMSSYYIALNERAAGGEITEDIRRLAMEDAVEKYPESEFAGKLKVELGVVEVTPDMESIRAAERVRLSSGDPDEYLPMYQSVIDEFPGTTSAYKARFVMAYSYEHDAGEMDKALEIYRSLAEEEPNYISSEYVVRAREKLTYYRREPEMLAEIQRYLAGFAPAPSQTSSMTDFSPAAETGAEELSQEYSGLQKIRARNARIRNRYFTN